MHTNKKRKILTVVVLTVVALAVFGAIISWALASMVSALIGACIWIKASIARVTKQDDQYWVGADMRGEYEGQDIWVNSTSMKQSALNKNAAIFTALVPVFQAMPELLRLLDHILRKVWW